MVEAVDATTDMTLPRPLIRTVGPATETEPRRVPAELLLPIRLGPERGLPVPASKVHTKVSPSAVPTTSDTNLAGPLPPPLEVSARSRAKVTTTLSPFAADSAPLPAGSRDGNADHSSGTCWSSDPARKVLNARIWNPAEAKVKFPPLSSELQSKGTIRTIVKLHQSEKISKQTPHPTRPVAV